MTAGTLFLTSAIKRLSTYKELCDKTLAVLPGEALHVTPNGVSNSIAVIMQHMSGNMLSRWTDFLNSDGEKEWRNRDTEFENQQLKKEELVHRWEAGWACCLNAIGQLTEEDLVKTIHIRGEALSVVDAINRQLAHYPYHVGQIIYIAKMIKGQEWQSLSIPMNQSAAYNQQLKDKK